MAGEAVGSLITPELKAAFEADGIVKIPGAVGDEWIERIQHDAQRQLDSPGPWVTDTNPGTATDRLFTTRYLWQSEPTIREFVFSSPIAAMAAALTGSTTMRFYFDHLLVKELRTTAPTPWHQGIPYWPFLGKQIVSAWVSASRSSVSESALEFVRGSHRWGAYYAPESFDGESGWTQDFEGEPVPDIESSHHRVGEPLRHRGVRCGARRRRLLLGLDHPRSATQQRRRAPRGAVHSMAGRRCHLVPAPRLRSHRHPGGHHRRARALPSRRRTLPGGVLHAVMQSAWRWGSC